MAIKLPLPVDLRRTEELTAILDSDSARMPDGWKFTPTAGQALRLQISATDEVALQNIIGDMRVIRDYSNLSEILDWHLGFSIRGVERKFLSRRFARGENAAVLRRAILDHRNQLHVSPHSGAEDDRKLEGANTREISFCAESAAENHALVEAARLLRYA